LITNICPDPVAIAAIPPPPAMLAAAPSARYFGDVTELVPSNIAPAALIRNSATLSLDAVRIAIR
jgi:hypothetical protein